MPPLRITPELACRCKDSVTVMPPEVARFTGDAGRDLEMKGFVISATEYLEDLLPPVLVGEEMVTLLRPEIRREGVSGVFATSERDR